MYASAFLLVMSALAVGADGGPIYTQPAPPAQQPYHHNYQQVYVQPQPQPQPQPVFVQPQTQPQVTYVQTPAQQIPGHAQCLDLLADANNKLQGMRYAYEQMKARADMLENDLAVTMNEYNILRAQVRPVYTTPVPSAPVTTYYAPTTYQPAPEPTYFQPTAHPTYFQKPVYTVQPPYTGEAPYNGGYVNTNMYGGAQPTANKKKNKDSKKHGKTSENKSSSNKIKPAPSSGSTSKKTEDKASKTGKTGKPFSLDALTQY